MSRLTVRGIGIKITVDEERVDNPSAHVHVARLVAHLGSPDFQLWLTQQVEARLRDKCMRESDVLDVGVEVLK